VHVIQIVYYTNKQNPLQIICIITEERYEVDL